MDRQCKSSKLRIEPRCKKPHTIIHNILQYVHTEATLVRFLWRHVLGVIWKNIVASNVRSNTGRCEGHLLINLSVQNGCMSCEEHEVKIDAKGQQYLRQSLGSRAMMNQNSEKWDYQQFLIIKAWSLDLNYPGSEPLYCRYNKYAYWVMHTSSRFKSISAQPFFVYSYFAMYTSTKCNKLPEMIKKREVFHFFKNWLCPSQTWIWPDVTIPLYFVVSVTCSIVEIDFMWYN